MTPYNSTRNGGPKRSSITCLLGAGFSYVAGVPLARELLTPNWLITMSERSRRRFLMVRNHYENWQKDHPDQYPEQYMGLVYTHRARSNPPKWDWVVEYICAVIASAGTPPASLNRNPRYSKRSCAAPNPQGSGSAILAMGCGAHH
jgi:hypothetical protein